MAHQPPEIQRLAAAFALGKLSAPLRSDVLSDGSIAARFNLGMARQVNLSANIVFSRDDLFSAFQQVADGAPSPSLRNEADDSLGATVLIDADGAGIVTVGTKRWRFEHAALLSTSRERRLFTLEKYLAQDTLTSRDQEFLRELAGRSGFSNEDFLTVVTTLGSSLESFADHFRQRLETAQVGKADLIPEDVRHWEHLTAPLEQSSALAGFIDGELANEWRARLSIDPKRAFRSISFTFASPALVPRSLFKGVDSAIMIQLLESACEFDDPFALAGAFQLCADRLAQDIRFVALGERLLDRLFGDTDRLNTASQIFGAAFIVSTAFLAEHELLGRRPPFWRRLAAASHASLVVRSSGMAGVKQDGLLAWAMGVSGDSYVLSVLNDFSVEPMWRPEWIADNFLVADVFAHIAAQTNNLPLADSIAEICIEKTRIAKERGSVSESVFRLVESAAANSDHSDAQRILAQRLETLAFSLPTTDMLADLVNLLECFKQIEPGIAPLLGRALAVAKLGNRRSVGA